MFCYIWQSAFGPSRKLCNAEYGHATWGMQHVWQGSANNRTCKMEHAKSKETCGKWHQEHEHKIENAMWTKQDCEPKTTHARWGDDMEGGTLGSVTKRADGMMGGGECNAGSLFPVCISGTHGGLEKSLWLECGLHFRKWRLAACLQQEEACSVLRQYHRTDGLEKEWKSLHRIADFAISRNQSNASLMKWTS